MSELKLEKNHVLPATTSSEGTSLVRINTSIEVKGSLELPSSDYAVASSFLAKAARAGIQISLVGDALAQKGYFKTTNITEARFEGSNKIGEVAVGENVTMAYQWTEVKVQELLDAPTTGNLLSDQRESLAVQLSSSPAAEMVEMNVIIKAKDQPVLDQPSVTGDFTNLLEELNRR